MNALMLISPSDWFEYAFGTVFAIGLAILLLAFIAAMMGFFDK